MPIERRPSAAHLVCSLALLCMCGCVTEPLTATAPKDVDLTGEWQINANLSDDPTRLQDNGDSGGQSMRRRGGGGGGGPGGGGNGGGPFGMPGGAGGRGGGGYGGSDDFVGSSRLGSGSSSATGSTLVSGSNLVGGSTDPGSFGIGPSGGSGGLGGGPGGASAGPGSSGAGGGGPGGPGGRRGGPGSLLAAPDHMTIEQNGGKLRIQTRSPGGDLMTDEYTFGDKSTVPFGRDTAERAVGWKGSVLVIETKVKDGPSKEADYALDESGHLIMTTLVSGGHMRKTELKRVYDRVTPAR